MCLPYGISSAPGYFQEIMEQLTADLEGVVVYLDDILVSGANSNEHLKNLKALLKQLNEKGLRCNLDKCVFAQPSIEYLGHIFSNKGIGKGPKVDAVMKMPAPTNVSSLRSFLGSIQFYNKFLPNLSTTVEPLYNLLKKNVPWKWASEEEVAFKKLKNILSNETLLAHFDPTKKIGIACDASDVGIGAVLFHHYEDGSERPIANASKTLSPTQRKYGQIQKEALAIIFALKKFHQFLYGRRFILVTDHKPLEALFGPTKPTPALAANRLARWALMLSQYDYKIEYRSTKNHANADVLSRLPVGDDPQFDGEESGEDLDTVCTIKTIGTQLSPTDPRIMVKETSHDKVLSTVIRYTQNGWPPHIDKKQTNTVYGVENFSKLKDSLHYTNGCLFHGSRLVVPESLQKEILKILHLGHLGIQRMKQLARTAVYWPGIDSDIVKLSQQCTSCGENQNKDPKAPVHPWMLPERPWSRIHIDHAINFMGTNWLVITDAYSKYPCIHPTSATSTRATIDLLEVDFAHFGYPHAIVSDNATTFSSGEFKEWCKSRGIVHLTGAPYHPATNGAAERLVQSFKNSLKKSHLAPQRALQEFLMQYRRTPLPSGYSPSELLNGRQIRGLIDAIVPSPTHIAQSYQMKHQDGTISKKAQQYNVGQACYALYCGPNDRNHQKWVPAVVTKVHGSRSVNVKVLPGGPIWRRHYDQLRPQYYMNPEDSQAQSLDIKTSSEHNYPRRSERLRQKSAFTPVEFQA